MRHSHKNREASNDIRAIGNVRDAMHGRFDRVRICWHHAEAYPAGVGFGLPAALALAAALDRSVTRSLWLVLMAVSFAVLNARRLHAAWLIPVVFATAAIWFFKAAWLLRHQQDSRSNRVVWWIAGTLLLLLGATFGPDLVMTLVE